MAEPLKLSPLIKTMRKAGHLALEIYRSSYRVVEKADHSPVTKADIMIDTLLVTALQQHFPSIAIVSEERAATHRHELAANQPFFLVDPIDGTREFINKTGEFTINIGLIENGIPVAGIVYAPVPDRLFIGEMGKGAQEIKGNMVRDLHVGDCDEKALGALASRSHKDKDTEAFLQNHQVSEVLNIGSSLKFCVLAAGEADIYPRFGPTMEWDTAAGDAVLRAAGGEVITTDGALLAYGKKDYRNPHFIACSPTARKRCKL